MIRCLLPVLDFYSENRSRAYSTFPLPIGGALSELVLMVEVLLLALFLLILLPLPEQLVSWHIPWL
jgi:hypothetical protein